MLLKLGNLWNFNQIKLLIFTIRSENPKYKIQPNATRRAVQLLHYKLERGCGPDDFT